MKKLATGFRLLVARESMRKDRGRVAQMAHDHDGVAGVRGLRYECIEQIGEESNN